MRSICTILFTALFCLIYAEQDSTKSDPSSEEPSSAQTTNENGQSDQINFMDAETNSAETDSNEILSNEVSEPSPTSEDEGFDNPFADGADNSNTDAGSEPEQTTGSEDFSEDGLSLDLIMDLAIGVSVPRVTVEPNTISTEGKPNFLFRMGILTPFKEKFFGAVSFQYLHLVFDLAENDTVYQVNKIVQKKTGKESLTFLSLPCKVGMRFPIKSLIPYVYAGADPTVLVAGYQNSRNEATTYFADSSSQQSVFVEDFDVTDKRNIFLPFVSIGGGLEINYGYGSVYLDVSLQYNPLDFNKKNVYDATFTRTSCKTLYIPVLLGMRFYL